MVFLCRVEIKKNEERQKIKGERKKKRETKEEIRVLRLMICKKESSEGGLLTLGLRKVIMLAVTSTPWRSGQSK